MKIRCTSFSLAAAFLVLFLLANPPPPKLVPAGSSDDTGASSSGELLRRPSQKESSSSVANHSALLFISAHRGCHHIPMFFQALEKSGFAGKVVVVVSLEENMKHCQKLLPPNSSSFAAEAYLFPFPMRAETQSVYAGSHHYITSQRSHHQEEPLSFIGVVFPEDVLWCYNPFLDLIEKKGSSDLSSEASPHDHVVYGVRAPASSHRSRKARPVRTEVSHPIHSLVLGTRKAMEKFIRGVVENCHKLGLNTRVGDCFSGGVLDRSMHRQLGSRQQYFSTTVLGCESLLPLPLSCARAPEVRVAVSVSLNCAATVQMRDRDEPCNSKFTKSFYTLPMESKALSQSTADAVSEANPELVAAWRKFSDGMNEYKSEVFSLSDSVRTIPKKKLRDAVMTIAAGYAPGKVELFLRSFLATTNSSTTTLVLFVSDVPAYSSFLGRDAHRVELVDTRHLIPRVHLAKHCGPAEYRFEMLASWLLLPDAAGGGGKNVDRFDLLLLIDSRDAFFQADPFAALRENTALAAAISLPLPSSATRRDFVVDVAEDFYAGSEDLVLSVVYGKNQEWLKIICGKKCFVHVTERTVGNTTFDEALPFVNSGQVIGSARGMLDTFRLMNESMMAGWEGRRTCLPDQGVMMLLFAGGFSVATFPHVVGLLTAERSRFRNLAASPSYLRWDRSRRLINCDHEVYAVVHQLDRHPQSLRIVTSTFGINNP